MGRCIVLEQDGTRCEHEAYDIDAFLLSHPAGVYTVGRTLRGRRAVVELAHHEQRLLASLRAKGLWPAAGDDTPVRTALRDAWRRTIDAARGCFGAEDELRLTALVVAADAAAARVVLATMAEALPLVRGPVGVEVWEAERDAPGVKDSAWVRKRKHMKERTHQPHVNEVLLLHDGAISEGLSSNFFAVAADGATVYTAPEGAVLSGTVRAMVLRACDDLGVRVVLECPRVPPVGSEEGAWSGAFVTSTTRMVLDIDVVRFIDHTTEQEARPPLRFSLVPHPLIARIQKRTQELLDAVSVDVL